MLYGSSEAKFEKPDQDEELKDTNTPPSKTEKSSKSGEKLNEKEEIPKVNLVTSQQPSFMSSMMSFAIGGPRCVFKLDQRDLQFKNGDDVKGEIEIFTANEV